MANKKNKKKAQQPAPANKAAANSKVEAKKAVAKKNEKAAKSKKNEKPGFFARTKKYFASVKSEMKRVTWPDKKELVNYSVVVCASLIVVGVVIALLDAGFGEALALFSGLRGYTMSKRWYVVHTYSGYENRVKSDLEHRIETMGMQDRIFDIEIPMERVTEIKEGGKRETKDSKIFPGYVLVKVAVEAEDNEYVMSDDAWYVIRNTRGVTGFVGPESKPVPLTEQEVKNLGVEDEEAEVATSVEVNYKVGDFVRITGGNLADYSGVVQEINTETGRVKVTISMFGRETSADLALNQVELA